MRRVQLSLCCEFGSYLTPAEIKYSVRNSTPCLVIIGDQTTSILLVRCQISGRFCAAKIYCSYDVKVARTHRSLPQLTVVRLSLWSIWPCEC